MEASLLVELVYFPLQTLMEGTTRVAGRVMDVAGAVAAASSLWRDSEQTKLHIPHSS